MVSASDHQQILQQLDEMTLDSCILNGFNWFRHHWLPVVKNLERTSTCRSEVAWAFELTGDVYFVVESITEAIKWYRKAIRISPQSAELKSQLATAKCVLDARYEDTESQSRGLTSDGGAELHPSDRRLYYECCESIAIGRRTSHFVDDLRPWAQFVYARSLSVAGRYTDAYKAFHSACVNAEEIALSAQDWFYLPVACWENVSLWKTLYSRRGMITDLGLANFDRTLERSGPPEVAQRYSERIDIIGRKSRALLLRFHLYRSRNDIPGLTRLSEAYPQWSDVAHVLDFYQQYRRCPLKEELLCRCR